MINFNHDAVKRLVEMFPNLNASKLAYIFDCSTDTIYNHFPGLFPPGRPEKEIDERIIETGLIIGSPLQEIADECGVSVDTLTQRFSEKIAQFEAKGKRQIRQAQHRVGVAEGDSQMLRHLGKHRLGQRDEKPEEGAKQVWILENPLHNQRIVISTTEPKELAVPENNE